MADPQPLSPRLPRVPAYAWAWLQRSRPVLEEAAHRLTGQPASARFLDDLREQVTTDAFVGDVLVGAIADVAFNGRVPTRRPSGAAWDRGLTWWAAVIAGTTLADFEARSGPPPVRQHPLFDPPAAPDGSPAPTPARTSPVVAIPRRRVSPERAALAAALRQLLATADEDRVPASAVRQLLADLESRDE